MPKVENIVVQKTIVLDGQGRCLLLRRSKTDPRRPGDWDLPGGRWEAGESLNAGAEREVVEESGIKVKNLTPRFTKCKIIEKDGETYNYILIIYTAEYASGEVVLSYEHDEYVWVEKQEVLEKYITYDNHAEAIAYIFDNQLEL